MKIVVQRVLSSSVSVNNNVISKIGRGLNLLVCIEKNDSKEAFEKAARKILALRIFPDESGRMNKNLTEVKGEILAISQFTLSWDGRKGNRPSFEKSMDAEIANSSFDFFCNLLERGAKVSKGHFGAKMLVQIANDGPVTFSLDF